MEAKHRSHKAGRIIGDILIGLAVLLAADVLLVMPARISAVVLKADYRKVFIHELILCAVLLLTALDLRFGLLTRWKSAVLKGIGWILRAAMCLFSAVIIFFCGKVIIGGLINTSGPADRAIVLGLALENGEAAPDLISRLETGRAYLEKFPEARLILTGGNADDSGRTEAAVMHDILMDKGVPEERMILEDQASSTRQNFMNIAGMEGFSPEDPVVMISSDYHMDRAVRTAEKAGFTQVMRLPAPSGIGAFGANMLSEVVLNLNELTKRSPVHTAPAP